MIYDSKNMGGTNEEHSMTNPRSNSKKSKEFGGTDMTRRMVCGGLAGMVAKTVTAPFERIKILSQTGEHGLAQNSASVGGLYNNIIRNEGVLGLWAGNGANLLRIFPAKGVVFACNDFYERELYWLIAPQGADLHPRNYPAWVPFFGGALAGMTATAVTYPLDLARGRISGKLKYITTHPAVAVTTGAPSVVTPPPQNAYNGIINTLLVTTREEGYRGLYRGVTPTLLGSIPYIGIQFGTVGVLEKMYPHKEEYNVDGTLKKPPIWRKLCFGGIGGITAGLISYPNDTVRRLLQLQGSRGTTELFTGYWDCVRKTYNSYGIGRFYRGIGINLIRMAPNTAVQFGTYDLLTRLTANIL